MKNATLAKKIKKCAPDMMTGTIVLVHVADI